MRPEELLMPRYRVIKPYIHSPYDVGCIITITDPSSVYLTCTPEGHGVFIKNHFSIEEVKKYPFLFEPVPWFAERDIKDMPGYLLFQKGSLKIAFVIDRWEKQGEKKYIPVTDDRFNNEHLKSFWLLYKEFSLPLLEKDFLRRFGNT